MSDRTRHVAVSMTFAFVGATVGLAPEAGATTTITSFNARAQADAGRFTFSAPGFLAVDTLIDGGGPVAESVLDGLGSSQSFASLPYPSDNAVSAPGLFAGLTGLPALPAYPFYVSSSYPAEAKKTFAQPGLDLEVLSSALTTSGTAASGGGEGGSGVGEVVAHTTSTEDPDAGTVVAQSALTADMIDVGGVLKIASGEVSAKVTRSVGADPVRETSFVLNGVSIAGTNVGFNEKGFVVAGTGAPIPPDSPLTQSLRRAGIDVRYLAASPDPDGVTSPGLIITQTAQYPDGPKMIFTYILGRAAAHVTVS
jgi:hypothetical protein